ncbi:MAG: DUF1501 domain-containing protein [Pseudomonadota bacterium]
MDRRHFLRLAGAAPALGLLGGGVADAAASDYRVLVCLFLMGGNDGLNSLVPTDGAYTDYSAARPTLALQKNSLTMLSGNSAGHSFGMHPALAGLAAQYNKGRLAWIANVGPLIQPATAAQVMNHSVKVPSFLLSHSDQQSWQQGWLGDVDLSGWGGRALELLPTSLRNAFSAVTMTTQRTLVLGRNSPVAFLNPGDSRYWGRADLAMSARDNVQALNRMANWQFANQYDAEYSATFARGLDEATSFTAAELAATVPAGDFGTEQIGISLKKLASVLPVFKSRGYKRQVILLPWGNFDTHTNQRGGTKTSQDAQLAVVNKALSAFDAAVVASGLDQNVVTLGMTDFGRTLRPASGGGSDHAWGNHWFALGGPVAGGQVLGAFPTLVPGGPDDGDPGAGGRLVPTTSSDQVGATLMQWLGLPDNHVTDAFPYLANFSQKTIALLHA